MKIATDRIAVGTLRRTVGITYAGAFNMILSGKFHYSVYRSWYCSSVFPNRGIPIRLKQKSLKAGGV